MPVDKFGRHLHQHSGDHSKVYVVEDATKLVETVKEDIMTSIRKLNNRSTMFYLLAVSTDPNGRCRLINGETIDGIQQYIYKLPTAFISSVSWVPVDARLYINGVEKKKSELNGTTLNKGDKLSLSYKKNSTSIVACEFVMQYPYE